jgi:hypothetical protein
MSTVSRSARDEALSNVLIMTCIAEDVDHSGSLSRVSKAWRKVAIPTLYREVDVRYLDEMKPLDQVPDSHLLYVR